MDAPALIEAATGWTSFSGVFSTFFPLAVLLAVLCVYGIASRRRRRQ
ncbi:MAG: hypothetical protein JST31_05605 [Actinobacteria bacterium]|nr:hypothetical protein [Actinomycetota bacterium]